LNEIIIKVDIFTHQAMIYRAEVKVYQVYEEANEAGEIVRLYKEIYSFTELYQRTSIKGVCRVVIQRAADWLKDQGFSGLVTLAGNSAGDARSITGEAGITKYNSGESELYLSPFTNWINEQKALQNEGCITYTEAPANE
jgi:hypothetical protein